MKSLTQITAAGVATITAFSGTLLVASSLMIGAATLTATPAHAVRDTAKVATRQVARTNRARQRANNRAIRRDQRSARRAIRRSGRRR